MCGNQRGVPVTTVFHRALLSGIIHGDDAKAFAIALRPLIVVEQGPDQIALDRHPLL